MSAPLEHPSQLFIGDTISFTYPAPDGTPKARRGKVVEFRPQWVTVLSANSGHTFTARYDRILDLTVDSPYGIMVE